MSNSACQDLITAFKRRSLEVMTISAAAGTNVRELLFKAYHLLQEAPQTVEVEEMPIYRADSDPNAFAISRTDDGWRISGGSIERAASMTYWSEFQSIRRFQRILETLGIDAALRKAGVENGDTVHIGEFELEWQD